MKLTHPNSESIELSHDLLWKDEFEWSDLAQTEPVRTLSGAYIVQQGIKKKVARLRLNRLTTVWLGTRVKLLKNCKHGRCSLKPSSRLKWRKGRLRLFLITRKRRFLPALFWDMAVSNRAIIFVFL